MVVLKNTKIVYSSRKKRKKPQILNIYKKKILNYQNIIQESIISAQKYKSLDIIDAAGLNICTQSLEESFLETKNIQNLITKKKISSEDIIQRLQKINNDLAVNFRAYGTQNIENLIQIVFGSEFIKNIVNEDNKDLYNIIKKYTHPISYKNLEWKEKNNPQNEKQNDPRAPRCLSPFWHLATNFRRRSLLAGLARPQAQRMGGRLQAARTMARQAEEDLAGQGGNGLRFTHRSRGQSLPTCQTG